MFVTGKPRRLLLMMPRLVLVVFIVLNPSGDKTILGRGIPAAGGCGRGYQTGLGLNRRSLESMAMTMPEVRIGPPVIGYIVTVDCKAVWNLSDSHICRHCSFILYTVHYPWLRGCVISNRARDLRWHPFAMSHDVSHCCVTRTKMTSTQTSYRPHHI